MELIKGKLNVGTILTIAGGLVAFAGSIITSRQQTQANHEIAQEVASILRSEMGKGLR